MEIHQIINIEINGVHVIFTGPLPNNVFSGLHGQRELFISILIIIDL